MDAIIINRVSDRKQKEGYSLDAQERHGLEYAKTKGFQIIQIFTFQETASKQSQRKKFHEALSFIENYPNKKTLAVIAEKSDRVGRNHRDKEILQELYRAGRIEVHLYKEHKIFDKNSNATDIFMDDVMTSMGKYAALNIARESIKGMQEKCEQGWYPVKAPLGYLNTSDPSGTKKHKILTPDPKTSHLVKRIFELRAEMKSYEAIRLALLEEGQIPHDKMSHFRHQSSIEKTLKNHFYGGQFSWRGQRYQGKHQLIITPDLWQKVHRTFTQRGESSHQKHGLFTNWIYCTCGSKVTYDPKKKTIKATGEMKEYPYYRCANGKKAHLKLIYVAEDKMLNNFGDAVSKVTITDSLANDIANALNETHRRVQEARKRDMDGYKAALVGLHKKEDEIYEHFRLHILDDTAYRRQIENVREERMRFTDLMEQAQSEIDGAYLMTAKNILELAKSAKELWLNESKEERRDFLEKILSNRVFDAPTVRYEMKKPLRILSEMASSSHWRPQRYNCRTFPLIP